MATTAGAIITRAFLDLGIIQPGEALSADYAQDALARLNMMVSGWQVQYGTVTAVERMVFPLTAYQQTYTIGLGGDFDVPRPTVIDGAALLLNGLASAVSITSITRSGYTATVTQTAHGYAVGDEVVVAGAAQIAYNGLQTVQTVPTSDTWTFTVEGLPTTPATGTLTAAAIEGQPVEIPRTIITDDAYQAIQIKNLTNAQFTNVYYNPTYPFGTVFLWPCPNTAQNQLVLYLKNVFGGFTTLTTVYDYPSLPGYFEALQYQLCLRLASPYGRQIPDLIQQLARETLGLIKRGNNKLTDLPSDAALLTNDRRGWFNINTGQGG